MPRLSPERMYEVDRGRCACGCGGNIDELETWGRGGRARLYVSATCRKRVQRGMPMAEARRLQERMEARRRARRAELAAEYYAKLPHWERLGLTVPYTCDEWVAMKLRGGPQ